jgi:hypothetical protein
MTFQPASNLLPTYLFQPKMAEIHRLEVFTLNTLGLCEKWGCQPTFQPLPTPVLPTPHTPLRVSPLSGAWSPL